MRVLRIGGLVLLVGLITSRAWMSDDAFITLRTLDNLVNGFGPRWNVDERVQTFTHPLWAFLLLGPYALTREPFFTTLACSLAVTGAALWLVLFNLASTTRALVSSLVILGASRAFVDYSTSGLENPLAHLLSGIFVWLLVRESMAPAGSDRVPVLVSTVEQGPRPEAETGTRGADRPTDLGWLVATAAALMLVRTDLIVLVGPALAWALWRHRVRSGAAAVAAGSTPLLAWTTFSLVYYGFPFPNTAYAKLNTAVPRSELVTQGLAYLADSLARDPVTLAAIAAVVLAAGVAGSSAHKAWATGVVAYLAYVVSIGGDYMSGRFLTAPLVAGVLLAAWMMRDLSQSAERRLTTVLMSVAAASVVALPALWPSEARVAWLRLRFATEEKFAGAPTGMFRFISDQQAASVGDSGLMNAWRQTGLIGNHPWAQIGKKVRADRSVRVLNWGAVGMVGYYAGPRVHVVDPPALGDPLLARLPATRPWFPGHFDRRIPEGYLESIRASGNLIADPGVHELYEAVRLITRGPLWSWERARTVVRMNLRRFDGAIAGYGADRRRLREDDTGWSIDDGHPIEIWERGLTVTCERACESAQLQMAVRSGERYRLTFLRESRVLSVVDLSPLPSPSPLTLTLAPQRRAGDAAREGAALGAVVIDVPAAAEADGYDAVRIELRSGRSPGVIDSVRLDD